MSEQKIGNFTVKTITPMIMNQDAIKNFAEFLKTNEPGMRDEYSDSYWELFAYRICDYLKV